ncbi:hypothetical protein [Paracoccus fistulariae]|nr:hypothetical protein [Paracoccus fistulariae]
MSRIPFIEARFFDPAQTRQTLEVRFTTHLRKLRDIDPVDAHDLSEVIDDNPETMLARPAISTADIRKIGRRTRRILERREAASGLRHLKSEDRERLQALRGGVTLIRIPNEHRADELAAELHAEMPWMAPATEIVWQAMRRSVREGWPGLSFDMSWVGWLLTSNHCRHLPAPLLSRCPPVRLDPLTLADLTGFAQSQGERRGLSAGAIAALMRR